MPHGERGGGRTCVELIPLRLQGPVGAWNGETSQRTPSSIHLVGKEAPPLGRLLL